MSDPNPENPCFVCGGASPHGMRLVFRRDEERRRVVGHFALGPEYQGGPGIIHGGIIAALLDEVMAKASRFTAPLAVTAELRIEYLKPVPVGQELSVEGFLARQDGRQLYHEGEIRNRAGELLARGQGRFVVLSEKWLAKRKAAAPAREAPEK